MNFKDVIIRIGLIAGLFCYTVFEIVLKIIFGVVILPALVCNIICVKLFDAKNYVLPLLAMLGVTTIISAKLLGPFGEQCFTYYLQEKIGFIGDIDDYIKYTKETIKEAFRG